MTNEEQRQLVRAALFGARYLAKTVAGLDPDVLLEDEVDNAKQLVDELVRELEKIQRYVDLEER